LAFIEKIRILLETKEESNKQGGGEEKERIFIAMKQKKELERNISKN